MMARSTVQPVSVCTCSIIAAHSGAAAVEPVALDSSGL